MPDRVRSSLKKLVGLDVVDVDAVLAGIEQDCATYLQAIAGSREKPALRRLTSAVANLRVELENLGDAEIDTLADGLQERGYDERFVRQLRDGLQVLKDALESAAPGPAAAGRREALERRWIVRQFRIRLAAAGVDVATRRGARVLAATLRTILKLVGEPFPYDMRPILAEARQD